MPLDKDLTIKWDNLCGVLDAQGFTIKNRFYPREIAFVSKNVSVCYEVDPEWLHEDIFFDYKTFLSQKNHHGLSSLTHMSEGSKRLIKEKRIPALIREFLFMSRENKDSTIGVKNQQLFRYLQKTHMNFPLFDLEDNPVVKERCPTVWQIDKFDVTPVYCPVHCRGPTEFPQKFVCALRKAYGIWEWFKQKRKSDVIYDTIHDEELSRDDNMTMDAIFRIMSEESLHSMDEQEIAHCSQSESRTPVAEPPFIRKYYAPLGEMENLKL